MNRQKILWPLHVNLISIVSDRIQFKFINFMAIKEPLDYRTNLSEKAVVVEPRAVILPKSNALVRQDVAMAHRTPPNIRFVFWPIVLCVNLYDFLGLCHLVPTHTLHLSRPFVMTTSNFQVFHRNRSRTLTHLPMISN